MAFVLGGLFRSLGDELVVNLKKRSAKFPFRRLLSQLCLAKRGSYAAKIADASAVKTFAAILGTSSKPEVTSGSTGLFTVSSGYARDLEFWKRYLGVTLDPTGRRYAEHLPNADCSQFQR